MSSQSEFDTLPGEDSGVRKASILILALGDELAREVFTRLSEAEIRELGRAASSLTDVTPRELVTVLQEFKHSFSGGWLPSQGAGSVFQLMAERVFGEERARDLLASRGPADPFEACNGVSPSRLAGLLSREHPQTAAVVLASMDESQATKTLAELPADLASDIVVRIANLNEPSEEVRRDIGDSLAEELRRLGGGGSSDEGAQDSEQRAVQLIKGLSREDSDELFARLRAQDEGLADSLRGKLFVFDDLSALQSLSMQQLLREVDSRQLAVAMKGAPEDLQDLIYASMSSRAADMLRDDLEAMGPTPLSDVEEAQEAIVEVALRLEEDGVLTIPRGGDSDFV